MKLFKKSLLGLAFLGLLGATHKVQANQDGLIKPEPYPQILYEKIIDGNTLQVTLHALNNSDEHAAGFFSLEMSTYKIHTNQINGRNYASLMITKDNNVKKGHLNSLHIEQHERKKNYGTLLYACAIKAMMDLGCDKISWTAAPNDLLLSQTEQEMLPKLIKFYEQLGAKTVFNKQTSTSMELTNFQKAREGIYTILEKWELKDLENSNNTQALQRAAAIVNHIAPK